MFGVAFANFSSGMLEMWCVRPITALVGSWPGFSWVVYEIVFDYVRVCDTCLRNNNVNTCVAGRFAMIRHTASPGMPGLVITRSSA